MPPDLPVLMFVDRQVPRFQRWTGIPKWRVAMNLRCAFGGLLGLSILSNPTSHPVWTFWGGVLMAAWVVIGNVWTATYRPTGKQEQETADKIATPIFNYLMYGSRSGEGPTQTQAETGAVTRSPLTFAALRRLPGRCLRVRERRFHWRSSAVAG